MNRVRTIERSWVRNPSGGFRMLGSSFTTRCLAKISRDASSVSETDRNRSLNQG